MSANQKMLGKLPKREDRRNILFKNIIRRELLPPLPAEYDVDVALSLEDKHMFANDEWGDCVIAGRAHMTLRFEVYEEKKVLPITDQDVLNEYWKEQGDGSHPDNGLVMLDSLNRWRKDGWATCGNVYDIYAYAELDRKDHPDVQYCVYLLEGAYAGFQVPQSAIDQFDRGALWDVVPNDGGILGGHCVYIVAFTSAGPTCVTWGKRQPMTWAFWDRYFDEAYGIVDSKNKWTDPSTDPVDVVKLDGYLSEIASSHPSPSPSSCILGNGIAKALNLSASLLKRKGRFYYLIPPQHDEAKIGLGA